MVAVYWLLNAVVLGCGIVHLIRRPEIVTGWWEPDGRELADAHGPHVAQTGWSLAAAALACFPRLALGLSGFELTMIVMPLVAGLPGDDPRHPHGRVRATRKMLVVAAVIGSVALIASATVTSVLIPTEAFYVDGRAAHRAHRLSGPWGRRHGSG